MTCGNKNELWEHFMHLILCTMTEDAWTQEMCQKSHRDMVNSRRKLKSNRTCICGLGRVQVPSRCMGAKFSVLPQREETAAQMSERGTLAMYSERLVLIGCQLVVCRHGCGGAPSARALGSAPVHFPRTGIVTTPLTQPLTERAIFQISLLVFTILPLI
jgi:hypothetical protein